MSKKVVMGKNLVFFLCLFLAGCGFHLRGHFAIPDCFRQLVICPAENFDPFQRVLKRILRTNRVEVIEGDPMECDLPTLQIVHQALSERGIAFGSDAQTTRSRLQFELTYRISYQNNEILPETCITVSRDLDINPNATLGTDYEREKIKEDLYVDAASQLIRQFSLATPMLEQIR